MVRGETDLQQLLASMRPELAPDVYVFVTTTQPVDRAALRPLLQFEEAEGTTLIVPRAAAEVFGLAYEFPSRMITLNVHSSLAAVGFLAAVAARLADSGIAVNPVAGFFHDHLFVPAERADDALALLVQLAAE